MIGLLGSFVNDSGRRDDSRPKAMLIVAKLVLSTAKEYLFKSVVGFGCRAK